MTLGAEEIDLEEPAVQYPSLLAEFGEMPDGFVPVFVQVDRDRLDQITQQGLRTQDNPMAQAHPELEKIFEQERSNERKNREGTKKKRLWVEVKRTECVFAYPRHPNEAWNGLGFDPDKETLLEAIVDSKNALVVNAESYTNADGRLYDGDKKGARDYARYYWQGAVTLEQYRREGRHLSDTDKNSFMEVLIPIDIPPTRLRVAKTQPES